MTPQDSDERRRGRNTLLAYLVSLGAIVVTVLWLGRFVLFQPWTARDWVSGAAIGRTLFLFGGRGKGGDGLVESFRVDLPSRRINRGPDLPSPRFAAAVAATPSGVAVIGGYSGTRVLDEILLLEHGGRLREAGRLPAPRAFAAAAAVGSEAFCVGGWTGEAIVADITAVDPASGNARLVGRLPSAREQAAAALSGGRLYVVGGVEASGTSLDEVLELAAEDGSVLRKARLPLGMARCAVLAVDSGVLVVGGWTGKEERGAYLVDNRGRELVVSPIADLPIGLSSVTAVQLSGDVVIAGGRNEEFPRQIGLWIWSPESGTAGSIKLRSFLFW